MWGYGQDVSSVGQRIRKKRMEIALSQEKLAQKLSVSKNTVARWEADQHPPSGPHYEALADLFGVTADWLMRGEARSVAKAEAQVTPEWAEFCQKYEHIDEFSEEQLADIRDFSARQFTAKSWMDYMMVAESIRRARPSPTFEAKRAARAKDRKE